MNLKDEIKEKWGTITLGVLSFIFSVVGLAVYNNAENWIKKTTAGILDAKLKDPEFLTEVIENIDANLIGATYQAHFILGENEGVNEYFLPIYVTGNNLVTLQLEGTFSGTKKKNPNFELYLNSIKIPLGKTIDLNSPAFTAEVVLSNYIPEVRKVGVYNRDKSMYMVGFRIAKERDTNPVVVTALINVEGLVRIVPSKGEKR